MTEQLCEQKKAATLLPMDVDHEDPAIGPYSGHRGPDGQCAKCRRQWDRNATFFMKCGVCIHAKNVCFAAHMQRCAPCRSDFDAYVSRTCKVCTMLLGEDILSMNCGARLHVMCHNRHLDVFCGCRALHSVSRPERDRLRGAFDAWHVVN